MIRTIAVEGLGPHENTTITLDPVGRSEVAGPSEIGKTQLTEAICFAFFGTDRLGRPFDLTSMRDGHTETSVTLTLGNGTEIHRSVRVTKKGGRIITRRMRSKDGATFAPKTEKDWLSLLAEKRFKDPQLMRLVMVPHAWTVLAHGELNGKPLRDALAKVLPKADLRKVVAELMKEKGAEMHDGDAISEPRAKEQRARASKARDKAEGLVEGIRDGLTAAEADRVEEVDNTAIKAAHALSSAVEAWAAYDGAQGLWETQEEQRARQSLDLEEWHERADALGKQPDGDGDAIERAKSSERDAVRGLDNARRAVATVENDHTKALDDRVMARGIDANNVPDWMNDAANAARRRRSDALAAIEHGGECPTCKQPWDAHVDELKKEEVDAAAAVEAAEAAIEQHRATAAEERDEQLIETETRVEDLAKRMTHLTGQMEKAEAVLEKARAELVQTVEANSGAADWQRGHRALGDEPPGPAEAEEAPPEPEEPRPTDEARAAALETLADQRRVEGKQAQRERDVGTAQASFDAAELAFREAKAEAARLELLVESVRAAPSVAVRRQLKALGDMGCVSLELPEGGGCEVRVDGRRWHQASTGRHVVADALFRAGIRRAMKAGYLQIFVDMVQSVGGMAPAPVDDPVVLLRTTDSAGLEVR